MQKNSNNTGYFISAGVGLMLSMQSPDGRRLRLHALHCENGPNFCPHSLRLRFELFDTRHRL